MNATIPHQRVAVLGSTGSIGTSTLDVISRHPERFRVVALSAHQQVDSLWRQVIAHEPEYAVVGDADGAARLSRKVAARRLNTRVLCGTEGLESVAQAADVDTVMAPAFANGERAARIEKGEIGKPF